MCRLKDGHEIIMTARIRVQSVAKDGKLTEKLIIDDAQLDDIGMYEAIVSNEAGQEHCTAQLEVVGMWIA